MKNTNKLLLLLIFLPASILHSQTIDYSFESLSTSSCNIFANATIIDNYEHLTTLGRPRYSDNSIHLQCQKNNSTTLLTTIYSIKYNFKAGYNYKISINYKGIKDSRDGLFPDVGLKISTINGGADANTSCIGPSSYLISNASTFIKAASGSNYTWANNLYDVTINQTADYLLVGAFDGPGTEHVGNIYIRKIQIVETAPTPSFTLSPTSVNKICGTALSQTFTATGTNIPPGATVSYLWNLGSSSNGWLYNGTAAPATITTTTNTLALTASTCDIKPANITVTATVNGANYNAGTATVSLTPFQISGPSSFCGSTASYSIANLGCSGSVTWSVSNSNVLLSCTSCDQPTLTKVTNGSVTLTATISNACGAATTTLTKNITVGAPAISITSNNNYPCSGSYQTWLLSIQNPTDGSNWYWYVDYVSEGGDVYIDNPYGSFTYVNVSGTAVIRLSYTDLCGATKQDGVTVYSYCSEYGFTMSPNPARETVTVKSTKQTLAKNSSPDLIYAIKITDRFGTVQKSLQYKSGVESAKISLSGLKAGMYILSVFDNKKWSSQTLIIPD